MQFRSPKPVSVSTPGAPLYCIVAGMARPCAIEGRGSMHAERAHVGGQPVRPIEIMWRTNARNYHFKLPYGYEAAHQEEP